MHKDLKKIKPTMRIVSRHKVKDTPGIIKGQTVRPLCGAKQVPSERIRVGLAQFKPNLHEHLHLHPIEVFYYVLKGSAVVHDLAPLTARQALKRRSLRGQGQHRADLRLLVDGRPAAGRRSRRCRVT